MTDNDIIIEVAKLDGKELGCVCEACLVLNKTNYLTSRDAIIPVIEKVMDVTLLPKFMNALEKQSVTGADRFTGLYWYAFTILKATPKQLCIALLKATGKWKE